MNVFSISFFFVYYSSLPHDYNCTKDGNECCSWYLNDYGYRDIVCLEYQPSIVDSLFEHVRTGPN